MIRGSGHADCGARYRCSTNHHIAGSGRNINSYITGLILYLLPSADAKAFVVTVLDQFGWESADMGTAVAARAIEPLAQLWCIPGFRENRWAHAFKVLWQ